MPRIIHALQNDTVDAICWREYGYTAGIVEKVFEENPKLSSLSVFLPMGTEVVLPDQEITRQTKQAIYLWG